MIFKRQKEEVKNEIKEEIADICENGKLIGIGLVIAGALITGFFAGSISTAMIYSSVQRRY